MTTHVPEAADIPRIPGFNLLMGHPGTPRYRRSLRAVNERCKDARQIRRFSAPACHTIKMKVP
jgi:hypothetical protein